MTDSHTNATRSTPIQQRLAVLALVLMAIIWGYNWVVLKRALTYVGPFDFTAMRTVAGASMLFILVWLRREPIFVERRAVPRILLLGVLQTGMFSLLIQLALMQGDAGKSSILAYTMPFWVIPMAWFAFNERIRGLQWVALLMAAAGLITIVQPWQADGDLSSKLLAIAAGFFWAMAAIVTKWLKRDFDVPVLQLTAWQLTAGSVALIVAALIVHERPIDPAPYFWFALGYNALLASSMAWFFWLFSLQHLPAGVAGMTALGVPVVSVISGWIELGETSEGAELIGMVLIAGALAVISVRSLKTRD